MDESPLDSRSSLFARLLNTGFGIVAATLVVLWVVESADSFLLSDRLQANGIHPRKLNGLDGILWAPLLHDGFGHLASNSIPFVVLGWLVSLRSKAQWAVVTIVSIAVGGALTWLFAGLGSDVPTNHIGASGVVFGYFGALVGAAFYERRPATLAPALVAIFLYGGILAGLVPQSRVSWEGHLFGLIAGVLAARWMSDRSRPAVDETDPDPSFDWPDI